MVLSGEFLWHKIFIVSVYYTGSKGSGSLKGSVGSLRVGLFENVPERHIQFLSVNDSSRTQFNFHSLERRSVTVKMVQKYFCLLVGSSLWLSRQCSIVACWAQHGCSTCGSILQIVKIDTIYKLWKSFHAWRKLVFFCISWIFYVPFCHFFRFFVFLYGLFCFLFKVAVEVANKKFFSKCRIQIRRSFVVFCQIWSCIKGMQTWIHIRISRFLIYISVFHALL